jgi:soluble epoxide hydrolase/lipid-phosphate phosphatase
MGRRRRGLFFAGSRDYMSANLYPQIPPIPFFSREEEDYWVEQYSISGFKYSEFPQCALSPFTYSVTNPSAVSALQLYTEEVPFIAFVSRYSVSHATLQNHFASWKFANEQGNHTIHQPILSILPTEVCPQGHQRRNFR